MGDVLRLNDPTRAFWLTRSVARTAGVNMGNAISEGRLTPETYAAMVTRCRACRQSQVCEAWLARGPLGEAAPQGCRNETIFHQLAQPRR